MTRPRPRRAESALRNALAVDSDNAVSHENLARLYYDRGRLHERSYLLLSKLVVTQATRVLEQRGTPSAELHNLHGLLLMEDGDQVSALRAFRKATEVDPEHAQERKARDAQGGAQVAAQGS